MIRTSRILALPLLLLPAWGCSETARATAAADVDAIDAVREREASVFGARDLDALAAIFTDDAVIMPPGEATVNGTPAIRDWAEGLLSQFDIEANYEESDVTVAGDWAFERYTGRMVLTPRGGGDPMEVPARGIHVYRRQDDGSWRIAQDIWNAPAAPAATGAP